jgi:hypothetical protein
MDLASMQIRDKIVPETGAREAKESRLMALLLKLKGSLGSKKPAEEKAS